MNLGKDRVKAMCESFGARVTGSVSGKTDILIVGKEPGTLQNATLFKLSRESMFAIVGGIVGGGLLLFTYYVPSSIVFYCFSPLYMYPPLTYQGQAK